MTKTNLGEVVRALSTSLVARRVYILVLYVLILRILRRITPVSFRRRIPFLRKRPNSVFIELMVLYFYYTLYCSVLENRIAIELSPQGRGIIYPLIAATRDWRRLEIYHTFIPELVIPQWHRVIQAALSLVTFYFYSRLLRHHKHSYSEQVRTAAEKLLGVTAKKQLEEASVKLEYYLTRKNYPRSFEQRAAARTLLSFKCDKCGICTTFSNHSSVSGECYYDFDHYCPWIGQEVYQGNFCNFYLFLLLIFATACCTTARYIAYLLQLDRIVAETWGLVGSERLLAAGLGAGASLQAALMQLMSGAVVALSSMVQLLMQTRNLYSVFNADDRFQLRCMMQDCARNKARIALLQGVREFDAGTGRWVKNDQYYLVPNVDGHPPDQPVRHMLGGAAAPQWANSYSSRESMRILRRLRRTRSAARFLELLGYLRLR